MSLSNLWLAFGTASFRASEAAQAMGVRKASSTLSRYVQEGVFERVGRGRYRFARRPRTREVAARLLEVESTRQAEMFPTLAGETMRAWRESGRFVKVAKNRYRLKPGGKRSGLRRIA